MRLIGTGKIAALAAVLLIASTQAAAQTEGLAAGFTEDQEELVSEKSSAAMLPGTALSWLEKAVDPDEYILGPYDRLIINIIGPEPKSFTPVVLPEGDVFLPGMGVVRADGLTLTDFRSRLNEEVSKYFRNVKIFCYLYQPRVFRVFVTGEVPKPGPVQVSAVERVSDAIEKAGSIVSRGSNRRVILDRGGKKIEVDILKFVLEGDFSSNPFLSNGDRIHVPVAEKHALVKGSVRRPSVYEVLPDETIADLIELGGGFTGEALADSVLFSRVKADGSVGTRTVASSVLDKIVLEDRDEVNVMNMMTGTSRVYVFGATQGTGHYYITEGEGLASLMGRVPDFKPDADLAAASIERKNGEIVRLDLRDYLPPNPRKDMPLTNGDMLHIPVISRNVAVGGEVKVPGQFPYEGDWTVAQYIGLAGGPTKEGSIDRIVIYSPDGKYRRGDRNMRPNRGDIIIVKRSKADIAGEFFSGMIRLGTVVISIIVLSQ